MSVNNNRMMPFINPDDLNLLQGVRFEADAANQRGRFKIGDHTYQVTLRIHGNIEDFRPIPSLTDHEWIEVGKKVVAIVKKKNIFHDPGIKRVSIDKGGATPLSQHDSSILLEATTPHDQGANTQPDYNDLVEYLALKRFNPQPEPAAKRVLNPPRLPPFLPASNPGADTPHLGSLSHKPVDLEEKRILPKPVAAEIVVPNLAVIAHQAKVIGPLAAMTLSAHKGIPVLPNHTIVVSASEMFTLLEIAAIQNLMRSFFRKGYATSTRWADVQKRGANAQSKRKGKNKNAQATSSKQKKRTEKTKSEETDTEKKGFDNASDWVQKPVAGFMGSVEPLKKEQEVSFEEASKIVQNVADGLSSGNPETSFTFTPQGLKTFLEALRVYAMGMQGLRRTVMAPKSDLAQRVTVVKETNIPSSIPRQLGSFYPPRYSTMANIIRMLNDYFARSQGKTPLNVKPMSFSEMKKPEIDPFVTFLWTKFLSEKKPQKSSAVKATKVFTNEMTYSQFAKRKEKNLSIPVKAFVQPVHKVQSLPTPPQRANLKQMKMAKAMTKFLKFFLR